MLIVIDCVTLMGCCGYVIHSNLGPCSKLTWYTLKVGQGCVYYDGNMARSLKAPHWVIESSTYWETVHVYFQGELAQKMCWMSCCWVDSRIFKISALIVVIYEDPLSGKYYVPQTQLLHVNSCYSLQCLYSTVFGWKFVQTLRLDSR